MLRIPSDIGSSAHPCSMTTTKRAYKLQEFVAHSQTVNCLKIGRKSSRILVTGGEDHKVNLWAIGKPNAILVGVIHFRIPFTIKISISVFLIFSLILGSRLRS